MVRFKGLWYLTSSLKSLASTALLCSLTSWLLACFHMNASLIMTLLGYLDYIFWFSLLKYTSHFHKGSLAISKKSSKCAWTVQHEFFHVWLLLCTSYPSRAIWNWRKMMSFGIRWIRVGIIGSITSSLSTEPPNNFCKRKMKISAS